MKLRLAFAVGVVAFLALLGGCANWSGQGPASGSVSLSVAIEKPRADAPTNSRQLVVKATATGGRIDRVEVEYQGPQSGKVSLSPQTGSWLGDLPGALPSGSYTLTAKAYSGSQVKDSVPVKFTLDVDPPTVQFLAPSLSVLGSGSVEVRVRATDALSGVLGVQLYAGTRLLGDMTPTSSGEYVFSLDASSLASGSVSLRAVAKDGAGNQGEATLAITVDKTPPKVTWLQPADGAVVSGTVLLRVEATDNVGVAKVEFFAGSTKIGEDNSAPYEISWNTAAYPDGPVTLKARAVDGAGNVSSEATLTVTVDQTVADKGAPVVRFVSPAGGVLLKGVATVEVEAEDTGTPATGVQQVQLYEGGTLLGTSTVGVGNRYVFTVDTAKLADGARELRAVAVDRAGNRGEARLTVTVDNTPPVVVWESPVEGQKIRRGAPNPFTLKVRVLDLNPDPSGIVYEVNGVPLAGDSWLISEDGRYTLTARVKDLAGNEAFASIRVDVDTEPPVVEWVAPSPGLAVSGRVNLRIKAEDTPGVRRAFVLVEVNGSALFAVDATSTDGIYWDATLDTSSLPNREVTLQAIAENENRLQSTAALEVKVNNPDLEKPIVEWLDPVDGQNVAGRVTLRVRALDNQSVREVRIYVGGTLWRTLAPPFDPPEWDTLGVADGPVVLKAIAIDDAGNRSDPAEIQVNVRNQGVPPALSILNPAEGEAVGVQFQVRASVTKQGTPFSWIPQNGNNLWARVYDYRGSLVQEVPLLVNGAQPANNADSVVEASFDLGNVPADLYRLVVEGFVEVNGTTFRLYQERLVSVEVSSNLPPALVIYSPRQGTVLAANTLHIVGDVTDDSGRVHAVEVRMIAGTCAAPGQENYLLRYEAAPYGLFHMEVPLDGHPDIRDGFYCLRVVAIDADNLTLRNIQEFDVRVNRMAPVPVANISVSTSSVPVKPGDSATWSVDFYGPATYVVLLRKDGQIVESYREQNSLVSVSRPFSEGDVGVWDVLVVFERGGVQGAAQGGSVAVIAPTGP
ncbi:Ig-like domain-containing protein [Thermus tengchongensis]|uniref:Ig-like domain-containing protein n=1 Tax=Thermus tengchongensis TaxID=1214928 RepID=A0A4Y9FCN7_9DEIN|nr:Ig-like domain-containing protein [Thermus tengchongensis]TFU26954.1 hypothetical protein E0687_04320 [Thermus tengchongensis]